MTVRVLIVDDNLANIELASFLLRRAGLEVARAMSAQESRAVAKSFKPSVVLMDIQLPAVDGVTAAKQLRSHPETHDVPIVAFTAYAMRGDEQRLLAAGFDGYIAKPVNPGTFAEQVLKYAKQHDT